jgi:hypothetical protein
MSLVWRIMSSSAFRSVSCCDVAVKTLLCDQSPWESSSRSVISDQFWIGTSQRFFTFPVDKSWHTGKTLITLVVLSHRPWCHSWWRDLRASYILQRTSLSEMMVGNEVESYISDMSYSVEINELILQVRYNRILLYIAFKCVCIGALYGCVYLVRLQILVDVSA